MELDLKQKVLLAVYMEYQKDIPDMERFINAKTLEIDRDAFKMALLKLQNEGLICGVNFIPDGNKIVPAMAWTSNVLMTSYGIKYVEEKLDIKPTMTSEEKLKEIANTATKWGLDVFKDIAARTLAEIIKGQ